MHPDRWQRVNEILENALEREGDDRLAFVESACAGDAEVRWEVEVLLKAHAQAGSFLSESPARPSSASGSKTPTLTPGTRIGPHEVTAKIGEGGMGEVYRATDTNLDRDVALKVLPSAFTEDPERLARLEREAKLMASLSHPNIGSIHGLEEAGNVRALVLELVEGPTLADRIAQGPIQIEEALPIGKQIAEALEAAHDQGVIHRDLKPANIKLRPDGTVKVLDFGLAKATAEPSGDPAESPTITGAGTAAGVLLGTAAYMSPEQARGKPAGKPADVWAFGCVFYEMLTGRRAFAGNTVSETLAAVLTGDADLEGLPADWPQIGHRLLRRCFERDPRHRLRDVRDGLLQVEEEIARRDGVSSDDGSGAEGTPMSRSVRWSRVAVIALMAFALGLVVALGAGAIAGLSDVTPAVGRFELTLSPPVRLRYADYDQSLALTSDGSRLVYAARPGDGRSGQPQLYVRPLDGFEAEQLLDLGGFPRIPFVSPDGTSVAFFEARNSLRRVSIDGGTSTLICDTGYQPQGGSWGDDDVIVFATAERSTGLWRVEASGGEPELLTTPDSEERDHLFPRHLPDGKGVLFTITADPVENSEIALLPSGASRHLVLLRGHSARYSDSGHLVFGRGGALWAVGFDLSTLEVVGEPVEMVADVDTGANGAAGFDLASDGTLVYQAGGAHDRFVVGWVDRTGQMTAESHATDGAGQVRLAPDGRRYLVVVRQSLWLRDLPSHAETRLAPTGEGNWAEWTPDGERISFSVLDDGAQAYWMPSDGASGREPLLVRPGENTVVTSWTSDGEHFLFYRNVFEEPENRDIWMSTVGGTPEPLVATLANEVGVKVSPDGRWFAYVSDELGENRLFLRSFPDGGRFAAVSPGYGVEPAWSDDGRELYYRDEESMLAVAVDPVRGIVDEPEVLFEDPFLRHARGLTTYDVAPDGRFLMIRHVPGESPALRWVLNWHEELLERVPVE